MTELIQTSGALDQFCEDMSRSPWVGVDTEFERIRTYHPRLCLIQISTPHQTVCIDPLVGLDLTPVARLLGCDGPLKIIHSARQDLEVINHEIGVVPSPLFDTQIAAAFCGFGEQVGYAALVEAICDIKLAKGYTRTAWCKRPLSTNQIAYALDDARFLGRLYEYLERYLQSSQRLSWAQEEFNILSGTDMLEASKSAAIEKISNAARGLTQVGQSIATELAKWREQAAMHCDQPRQWLLSNDQLLTIAAADPYSVIELAQIDNVAAEFCKRWGEPVIAVVECGRDKAVQFPVRDRPGRLPPRQKALDKVLWKELQKISDVAGLPPSLIARRDDIRALAAGKRDLLLLRGWRSEIAGKALLRCIDRYIN